MTTNISPQQPIAPPTIFFEAAEPFTNQDIEIGKDDSRPHDHIEAPSKPSAKAGGCNCEMCKVIGPQGRYCPSDLDLYREQRKYFNHDERLYKCREQDCNYTAKRWTELNRHNNAKHCTNAPRFPCPIPYCKFSGNNGFLRKDKLLSHRRTVHKGLSMPTSTQGHRAIRPAISRTQESGSASSSKK